MMKFEDCSELGEGTGRGLKRYRDGSVKVENVVGVYFVFVGK